MSENEPSKSPASPEAAKVEPKRSGCLVILGRVAIAGIVVAFLVFGFCFVAMRH